mgnify:CR=1 FL=1
MDAAIAAIQRGETKYTSNSGTIELRRAVSEHLAKRYNVRYDPETEILITVGVSEALHDAMLATLAKTLEPLKPAERHEFLRMVRALNTRTAKENPPECT